MREVWEVTSEASESANDECLPHLAGKHVQYCYPTGARNSTFKRHLSFTPSGCSGSAAKVPVCDPPPPAITCVGHPGRSQRVCAFA